MENQKSSFMANFSDDLLFEILLRLPHSRSAIKCSLVCKRWASLIFSDHFNARFDNHHHKSRYLDSSYALPFGLFFHHTYKTTGMFFASYELSFSNIPAGLAHHFSDSKSYLDFLPPHFSGETMETIISGDDLLLIETYPEPYYCVCNPLTKQWNILPTPPPNFIPFFSGLWRGYSNQNAPGKALGSYKVVVLEFRHNFVGVDYVVDAFIFCSESGEWSQRSFTVTIPKVFLGSRPYIGIHGVTSSGVIFLAVEVEKNELIGFLAVDPIAAKSEECRFVELPESFSQSGGKHRNWKWTFCFGVVRGRLRISLLVKNEGYLRSQRLRVWELREQASSEWILVHNMDLQQGIYVAAFHPNNGDVLFVIGKHDIFKLRIGEGEGEEEYEKVGEIPNANKCKRPCMECTLDVRPIVHTSWNGLAPPL